MKKPKSIFYLVYFLFHFFLLLISIYVNYRSEDFEFLLWLRERMDWMIYASVLGLLLFMVNMVMINMAGRGAQKEIERLEHEANSYKAKMFDLQEAKDTSSTGEESTPSEA
ncbi:MAG: hypothetical protein AAF843_14835 [Bacteroidota bacterium]